MIGTTTNEIVSQFRKLHICHYNLSKDYAQPSIIVCRKLININDLIRPNIVGGADVNKLLPKSVTNNLMMEMLNDADAPPKEVTDAPTPPATTIKFNGKMKESLKVLRLPHTDSLRAPKECTKSSPPPKARIEVMPIQLKKQLAMYCWDMSSICSGGRIMVSVFDQDRIRFIQEQLPAKIAAHCASLRPPMQEYRPEVGEFCLAIYADDDQWYRAECIGVLADGGGASLRFIDYGNVTHVKWARIRPMSEEFRAVPIMVHDCSIAGKC